MESTLQKIYEQCDREKNTQKAEEKHKERQLGKRMSTCETPRRRHMASGCAPGRWSEKHLFQKYSGEKKNKDSTLLLCLPLPYVCVL